MRFRFSVIIALFIFAAAAFGQAPNASAKKARMAIFDEMAGMWRGSGWILNGQTRDDFSGMERVQKKIDGLALLVEGTFTNSQGKIVHETLAVLSPDDAGKDYKFATYLANGIVGVQDLKIVGDHYEWGFEIPKSGTVRYSIRIQGDTWSEIGEFTKDGRTWVKTFEMKLDRVKPKRAPGIGAPSTN